MFDSFKAPKGSKTTKIESTITREYLDTYIDKMHPEEGNALNILFSSNDPTKYDVIPYLLSKKIDKSKAIEFAVQKKNYLQADDLIKHLNFNIISAVKNKSLILTKYFVEKKESDVNHDYFGSNLLSMAVRDPNNIEIAYYLLTKGSNVLNLTLEEDNQDDLYKPIFFKVIQENNFELVKKLVETYNFDVNTEYSFNTPLSIAVNLKNGEKIIEYLLSHGANLNLAMIAAAMEGNLQGIEILIQVGAIINPINSESPLMIATQAGHKEVVKFLLKHGANFNVQGWGESSLLYDVSSQVIELSKALKQLNDIKALKKINNIELLKEIKSLLNIINKTTLSSNYKYNELIKEKEELPNKMLVKQKLKNICTKLSEQLNLDLKNFIEINKLLKDYSSGKKVPIIDDDGYVSDFSLNLEYKTEEASSRLEPTNSVFFSLNEVKAIGEGQIFPGDDTADVA